MPRIADIRMWSGPPNASNNAAVHDVASVEVPAERDPSESLRRKSIVMMIHDARRNSSGTISFMRKVLTIIVSDTFFLMCLLVFMTLPLCKLFVGCVFLKQCRSEPAISIYLIVGGFLGCLRDLWMISMKWTYSDYDYEMRERRTFTGVCVMSVIETTVFLTGCSLVYGVQPFFSVENMDTCSPMLHRIAYWLVTLSLILLSLVVGVAILLALVASLLDDDIKKMVLAETMNPHYQNNIDFLKEDSPKKH